jgi:2,3-bisphosphoglycerate-independent phosphoglycerate mutase
VVYQDLLRINRAIADGSFFSAEALVGAMEAVNRQGSALHLMGLVSDGGVHSHIDHLSALLRLARDRGVARTYVHAFLDGRDTPPNSGAGYLKAVQAAMEELGYGRLATVCGRYYAMDRDTRWDRIAQAYRMLTEGGGRKEPDPLGAVEAAYRRGETDEFVKPIVLTGETGQPVATIRDGDGVIFFNFRADRARELTQALTDPHFDGFQRDVLPDLHTYVCLTRYDKRFSLQVAYPPVRLRGILGEVISGRGLRQLRIAETEKYAHVTYFFNGGEETPFPGEDRCLIPSPRDVATYDQKPAMSARKVTEELLKRLESERYDFVVLNFANLDMVGHTGVLPAAVEAVETVDGCLARILAQVEAMEGVAIVTADHGNSETMIDENGLPHTAHTLNPVHFVLVGDRLRSARLREGKLGDIAPTILAIMGIEPPPEMTGKSLIRM